MSSGEFEGCSAGSGWPEVGEDRSVDLACDVALEAADDFFAGLAFGESSGHVRLRGCVPSESADDDDVERSVGLAVAAAVESVASLTS